MAVALRVLLQYCGGCTIQMDQCALRCELPHTPLHDLRHFFITQCFVGGAGGPTVQKLAGHCHLSVTQRHAHTNETLMREAVQVSAGEPGSRVNGM